MQRVLDFNNKKSVRVIGLTKSFEEIFRAVELCTKIIHF